MRKFPLLIIILVIILGILLFLSYLAKDAVPMVIFLKDGDEIPKNICENLDNIIFIEQTGCPACASFKPRLEKLEKELDLKITKYNVAIKEDRDELINRFILPQHVPVMVINCKVYEGVIAESKLKEILK